MHSTLTKSSRQAWPPLLHRMIRTVRTKALFQRGQHILIAVSGGSDSIALLSLLNRLRSGWGLTLTAVHCNYGLRGSESEADQAFVTARCGALLIPLHVRRLDLLDRSKRSSIQATARDLRYHAFAEIADQCGADRIALGHTADDQAETILLWLLRGAGLTGLSGMPAVREERIIRPLYEIRKQDILTYLRDTGLPFREDSTNAKPLYLRNRIRQELLPLLNRLAPASPGALCRLANICREDDRYLDQQASDLLLSTATWKTGGGWTVDRARLTTFPRALQRRVIRNLIRRNFKHRYSTDLQTVDRIVHILAKGKPGDSLAIIGGHITVTNRHLLFDPQYSHDVERDPRRFDLHQQPLTVPGSLLWADTGQRIQVHLQPHSYAPARPERYRIFVDADRLSQPTMVRSWLPGDRLQPFGMQGRSKKIQDLFTDLHIPRSMRSRIPLVVAPEGIVWVVGYRQDHRWAPTSATKRCLVFTADEPPLQEGTA